MISKIARSFHSARGQRVALRCRRATTVGVIALAIALTSSGRVAAADADSEDSITVRVFAGLATGYGDGDSGGKWSVDPYGLTFGAQLGLLVVGPAGNFYAAVPFTQSVGRSGQRVTMIGGELGYETPKPSRESPGLRFRAALGHGQAYVRASSATATTIKDDPYDEASVALLYEVSRIRFVLRTALALVWDQGREGGLRPVPSAFLTSIGVEYIVF
jgi:hypothetical protein